MNHRFRPSARRELLEPAQWYLADGGPPNYPGVRTWAMKRFPYTLMYRVDGELITVVAVAHQSREPGIGAVGQVEWQPTALTQGILPVWPRCAG